SFSFLHRLKPPRGAYILEFAHARLIENELTRFRLQIACVKIEHFDAKERPVLGLNTVLAAEVNVGAHGHFGPRLLFFNVFECEDTESGNLTKAREDERHDTLL